MYRLLVLVSTVGLATADVGLGYNYYKPQTNFGPYRRPSYQESASSSQYNIGYNNANGYNYNNNGYPGLNAGFQNTANTVYHGVNQGFKPAIIKGDVVGSNSEFQNRFQGVYNTGNVYKESAAYQGANVANLNEINKASYQVQSQQAQVFKHFYVHAAPEDEEPPKPRTPIVLPPPQKHYKIIFIKAPTQFAGSPQIVPVPQQNEEKTIVYVLVNKPEDTQNVVVPKVEQRPPIKPEVYFIKYNNKEGSKAVIDNIVKDYNKDQSISFTNIATGVAPPSPVLSGTFGAAGSQINSASGGTSAAQNSADSGFSALNTQSSYESKPLGISTSGISDGTLASTLVDGYNSASSVTEFNGGTINSGYNGDSENTGFSGALSNTGFQSTSSSYGLTNAGGAVLSGESGGSGFSSITNAASNGNEYSTVSGILTSTGGAQSVTGSEYNGGTISTSQGLPHETYGIPKFSA
ncbi:uncharacterized protein LOC128683170 [Plodia interpunctella]|uniref:uncharacterized protein LOC128683170 n=1 Tax=Plodia interpunctella TaxID=58824 RepID=UPI002368E657|nr:uncharacterized protein LOC128683170 [Plodia interpunctella]